MARRLKSPGTIGSPVAVNQPNVVMLEAEDSKVTRVGTWTVVEDAEAVGGSYLRSNTTNSYLQFSFKGSALWIRFKFGSDCGKASVTIDDTAYPTIDLYNALDMFKYVNIAVGLDENSSHTVKIAVSGTKNASSTDYYVNVDAFTYRLTEEALSLQNIEYIDLINVINTINKINEIKLISNIANIDLVKELSEVDNIANISNVQNISNIANISLVQKISLIQEISTVGKINQLSTINQISLVANVTGISTVDLIKSISSVTGISNIGNIANISNVQNISNIANISNVANIANISVIQKIADAPWIANLGVAINGGFETGNLVGWIDPLGVATVVNTTSGKGKYSCKLNGVNDPGAVGKGILQFYYPPLLIDNIIDCKIMSMKGDLTNDVLQVNLYFTDGTSAGFEVPSSTWVIANDWYNIDLKSLIRERIIESGGYGGKWFYAIELENTGSTNTLHIDDFTLNVAPTGYRIQQQSQLLKDVSVTVSPNSTGSSDNAGYVPVTPRQVVFLSCECITTAGAVNVNSAEIHVEWFNADKTSNSEETIDITGWVSTSWRPKSAVLIVPEGVAYMGVHCYLDLGDATADRTLSLRNITVFPVLARTGFKRHGKELDAVSISAGGTQDVDLAVPEEATGCAVTVSATYDASATAGVKLEVYRSPDGTNWDTTTDDSFTLPFTAGATVQETEIVAVVPPYVRFSITNLDSTYAATVSLYVTFI